MGDTEFRVRCQQQPRWSAGRLIRPVGGFFAVALFTFIASAPAVAAEAAEADVVAVTQAIEAELAAFCVANRTPPVEDVGGVQVASRAPRHVAAKARDLLVRTQMLRRLNGLEEQAVAELPVKELTAQDAKEVADKALAAIRELRPSFGNPPPAATTPAGPTATDAFVVLSRAESRLEALDMPAQVPNDVYRAALRLMSDLDRIRTARGLPTVTVEPLEPGLTPKDSYDAAYALMEELKRLADEHPDFRIPGGLTLPERRTAGLRPDMVMGMISHISAEVTVLKLKAGVTQPTKKVAPQAGKTPSDTVAVLRAARQMVIAFRNS